MYGWHREISKIALHLPVDHPLRVAWALHIGNSLGQSDSALPSFYDDTISVGPFRVGTGMLNPFAQVPSTFAGTAGGLVKNLSPILKIPIQNSTGENPNTGKPFSRPGQHTGPPTAPSLFKQISDIFPQKTLADALLGNKDTASYSTGEEIKVNKPMTPAEKSAFDKQWRASHPKGERVQYPKETIPTGQTGLLGAISAFAGIPIYDSDTLQQVAANQAARQQASLTPAPKKKGGGSNPLLGG
jgi:hypothetical protein